MTSASPTFLILRESSAHSSSVIFGAMRPARRSVTMPLASSVQKLARAAMSPGLKVHAQAEGFDHAAAHLIFNADHNQTSPDGPGRCRE